jgi:phosphoenolpyruvate carboxykinase (GTP)
MRSQANQAVLDWVREVEALTKPENIFWCDGSEREREYLIDQARRQDVLIKLNDKKVPRSYLHRQTRTTSRASNSSHSSAHRQKKKPGRRTIGLSRPKPIQNFTVC